jgi:hypothetical protein
MGAATAEADRGIGRVMSTGGRPLLAALVVALLVRVGWAVVVPAVALRGDDIVYVELARSLLSGQGYQLGGQPVTHYMPGWPLLLSLFFGAGLGLTGARIALGVLSTLVCWEAYVLGRRLVSPRAGLVAAWFAALFPPLVWYADVLLSESASAVVVGLWAVVAVGYVQEGGGARKVVLLGAVSGLLVLFRAEMLITVPVPFLARALLVGWRGQVVPALAAAGLTLVLLLPWAAYNQHRLGRPILLTTAGGVGLWYVSHEPPFSDFAAPEVDAAAAPFRVPGDPILTDQRFAAEARQRIRARPLVYLGRRLTNLPRFWLGSQTEAVPGAEPSLGQALATRNVKAVLSKAIGFGTQALMVVAAWTGLWLFARRRQSLFPWLVIGAKVAAHAPFVQAARFSLHLAPLLLCYAGATLAVVMDRVRWTRLAPSDGARQSGPQF